LLITDNKLFTLNRLGAIKNNSFFFWGYV